MAFNIADIIGSVSRMDTQEQIEYIPLEKLQADPTNFYSLDGIDDLAANIEMFGLQQPLRVRAQDGAYVVISGHRRMTAANMIQDGGGHLFDDGIACIVEHNTDSPALQELRLIFANKSTRKLTPHDMAKQTERIEALLYQLQEEGYEFPGRMRDHVAQVLDVSTSKIARIKAIQNGLSQNVMKEHFEKDDLSETVAYAMSKLPVDVQDYVTDMFTNNGKRKLVTMSERKLQDMVAKLKMLDTTPCPIDPETVKCCPSTDGIMKEMARHETWQHCGCDEGCCFECRDLMNCSNFCPSMKAAKEKRKADFKAASEERKEADRKKNEATTAKVNDLWSRFTQARKDAGITVEEYFTASGKYVSDAAIEKFEKAELGFDTCTEYADLPYAGYVRMSDVDALKKTATALGCSIDYLFGLKNEMEVSRMDTAPMWHTGRPPKSGLYLADLVHEDVTFTYQIIRYDANNDVIRYKNTNNVIAMTMARWAYLPEE